MTSNIIIISKNCEIYHVIYLDLFRKHSKNVVSYMKKVQLRVLQLDNLIYFSFKLLAFEENVFSKSVLKHHFIKEVNKKKGKVLFHFLTQNLPNPS